MSESKEFNPDRDWSVIAKILRDFPWLWAIESCWSFTSTPVKVRTTTYEEWEHFCPSSAPTFVGCYVHCSNGIWEEVIPIPFKDGSQFIRHAIRDALGSPRHISCSDVRHVVIAYSDGEQKSIVVYRARKSFHDVLSKAVCVQGEDGQEYVRFI